MPSRKNRQRKKRGEILQKGCNSDVTFEGLRYHVQTEDWGRDNPFLVSRVFQDGQVIKSIKLAYAEIFSSAQTAEEKDIRLAIHEQHHQIVSLLLSGKLFS